MLRGNVQPPLQEARPREGSMEGGAGMPSCLPECHLLLKLHPRESLGRNRGGAGPSVLPSHKPLELKGHVLPLPPGSPAGDFQMCYTEGAVTTARVSTGVSVPGWSWPSHCSNSAAYPSALRPCHRVRQTVVRCRPQSRLLALRFTLPLPGGSFLACEMGTWLHRTHRFS